VDLLPVKISTSVEKPLAAAHRKRTVAESKRDGSIEITMGSVRVRIEGAADADCVRAALEGLMR